MTNADPITCYSCERTYRYLGRGHHPGRCPHCSSYCVAPAGDLTVVADIDRPSRKHSPLVTVFAIDERYRHFLYHFTDNGSRAVLDTLQVDGHIVCPANKTKPIPVPDPVQDVLARYDRFLLSDPIATPDQGGSIE